MEIKKGDRVITPEGVACTVIGVSTAGRATLVADDGTIIAIDAELLEVTERTFLD